MYRKSLLAMAVFTSMPLLAATDNTLYVTTFADENGENASACSLREALQAASTNRAFGGCIAGKVSGTDDISLEEGTYTLNSTLNVQGAVSIQGAAASSYDAPDAVNNTFPGRTALKTTIEGNNSFPLFDTTVTRNGLTITNVILQKGMSSGNGGAIRAGGSLSLNRVNILNSSAAKSGGAIYLEGQGASLNAADSLFEMNNAARGAVIGMSCIDNVSWTKRAITLERTAIVHNGSDTAKNIIEFCGTPSAEISASTIAQNTTAADDSAIIKYTHDQDVNNQTYVLHPSSRLTLASNTIVENQSRSTLLYDNVGALLMVYNVIAFNEGGLSCRYLGVGKDPDVLKEGGLKMLLDTNAFIKPVEGSYQSSDDSCSFPEDAYGIVDTSSEKFNLDLRVSGLSLDKILYPLKDYGANSGFLPVYLPKEYEGTGSLLNVSNNAICTSFDQRGLGRNVGVIRSGDISYENPNKCDIGSIEIGQLRAADFAGISNSSYISRVQDYEDNIEFYDDIINNEQEEDEKFINYYKRLLAEFKQFLAGFIDKNTYRFRQAYVSIFPSSVEKELSPEGELNSSFQKFDDDKYNVTVKALGKGSQRFIETRDESFIESGTANTILCQWNSELKQVMVSHVATENGKEVDPLLSYETPAGQYEYCEYTISLKSNPSEVFSTGYIQTQFSNIAPIAEDDEYTVKYGGSANIAMDILANDSDDGDGPIGSQGYPAQRLEFFSDAATGRFANIRIVEQPVLGTLEFEYEQPCPDNSDTRPNDTCYGGKLTYVAKNTFSPFNDSFSYKVLDEELKESNEAEVTIINTATTSDDTRSSGGGGSFGILGLFGLALLAVARRRLS